MKHDDVVCEAEVLYPLPYIAIELADHVSHSPAKFLRLFLRATGHETVADITVTPVCEPFGISGYTENPYRVMVKLG